MTLQIIAPGPPPLTDDAADAALDVIDFIAATVRGIDTIDVTPRMQELWRQHLAAWYQYLPVPARAWYASAPAMTVWIQTQWPFLPPDQRYWIQQQWTATLPSILMVLDPVLRQTADQVHPALSADIQSMRAAQPAVNHGPDPDLAVTRQLAEHARNSEALRIGSINMANSTIDLMRAMSRH